MSGYYPDGVSGREPQIAGVDEREIRMEMDCDNDDWDPKDGFPGTATCGFSGHVDITEVVTCRGRDEITGNRFWTCPRCGKEHEENDVVLAERDDPDEGDE